MIPKELNGDERKCFLKTYNTALHAYISSIKDRDTIGLNDAIENATKIALITVDNLFGSDGRMKKTSEIIESLINKEIDHPLDFPEVNTDSELEKYRPIYKPFIFNPNKLLDD